MKADASIKAPEHYLASLPASRQTALRTVHAAIRANAPALTPFMLNGFLGCGRYHYRCASGREGEWFVVGLTSQKQHISLYFCVCDGNGYLAEKNAHPLGKVSVGRSCVRFKRLEDLNLQVALELVRRAAALSGQAGAFAM